MAKSDLTGANISDIVQALGLQGYVLSEGLATTLFLLLRLQRPLLLEGHAGVGKTELARALSLALPTRLIRLQCYEGLDVRSAIYEWNYQRQLLAIKIQEQSDQTTSEKEGAYIWRGLLIAATIVASHNRPKRLPSTSH